MSMMDSIDSNTNRRVLNMDDIEHQKENIQPLQQGRKLQSLSKFQSKEIDSSSPTDLEDSNLKRELERETRERQLKFVQDTDDDPLDAYYQYILWIDQSYPTRPKFYMEIVEETVRRFRNDARYRDDIRFVRLWMKVAKIAPDPIELFKYLSVKGIGQNTSLFYEEYAALLETSKRYEDAKNIYDLGIQRKAAPVERLKLKFQEFQSRNDGRSEEAAPQASHDDAITDLRPAALSVLHDSSGSTTLRPDNPPRGILRQSGLSTSQQKGPQKIQVYKDENNEPRSATEHLLPGDSHNSKAWIDIPRARDQMKENTREATKWVGETLSAKNHSQKQNATQKFDVYRDEEEANANTLPKTSSSNGPILSEVKESSRGTTSAILQGLEGHEKKTERLVCNLKMLYKDGSEISIEEAKVERLGLHYTRQSPQRKHLTREEEIKRHVASPTINTKAALQDVFDMFNQPLTQTTESDTRFADQLPAAQNYDTLQKFQDDDEEEENVVWRPTDDETISASVFRPDPESLKISVFRDEGTDEDIEEPSVDGNDIIQQLKSELASKQGMNDNSTAPEFQATDDDLGEESFLGSDSFAAAVSKAYSTSTPKVTSTDFGWSRRRPQLDLLTPITEVSNESDRTFGGRSTIRSRDTSRLTLNSHFEDSIVVEDTMARFHIDRDKLLETEQDLLDQRHDDLPELSSYNAILATENNYSAPQILPEDVITAEPHVEEPQLAQPHEEYPSQCDLDQLEVLQVDIPCNPMNPGLRRRVMTRVGVPSDSQLFLKLEFESGIGEYIEQAARTAHLHPVAISDLDGAGVLTIAGKIGEGGYGNVYKMLRDVELDGENASTDEFGQAIEQLALKIQSPPSPWEYYMLYMLDRRLGLDPRSRDWFVRQESCHVFSNESCLLMKYYPLGSLLDCVNKSTTGAYGSNGGFSPGVDELLAAFWTVEILKMVETLHNQASVIHGDIKIDNFLLRMPDGQVDKGDDDTDWDSQYHADGSGGWASRGLVLIDWGMAIDLKAFPEEQMFLVPMDHSIPETRNENGASRRKSVLQKNQAAQEDDPSVECYQVRHELPWKFEPDWYGVAGVIHVLLFGKYMKVVEDPLSGSTRLATPMKRYWQTHIWQPLFEALLSGGHDPIAIYQLRLALEEWLTLHCNKGGRSLRNLLRRVESAMVID